MDSPAAEALLRRAAALVAEAGEPPLASLRPPDGAPGGLHASNRHGGGIEFAEHRDYAPGDELRHIDWHAYARRDRLLVKRFETEVHATMTLWLDDSASMALADPDIGRDIDKFDHLCLLVLALALVLLQRGDAVGVQVASGDAVPARHGSAQRPRLAELLARARPHGALGLERLAPEVAAHGPAMVFTDGLIAPADAVAPLAAARRAGRAVTLVQALHPLERDFRVPQQAMLHCEESGARTLHDPRLAAEAAALMARHMAELRHHALAAGVGYVDLDLGAPPTQGLRLLLRSLTQARRAA